MNKNPESSQNSESQPKEIERKFLIDLNNLPDRIEIMAFRAEYIAQGYMVIGEDGSESRLRERDGSYYLTVKSNGDLVRNEWETQISRDQFSTLWPSTEGRRVEKTRYSISFDTSIIELDVYKGDLAGLVTAEVEFEGEDQAEDFVRPEWFGYEVTGIKDYKNQNLALKGFPQNFIS